MLSEILPGEELAGMQKEKGSICISVIVPTHKLSPERRADEPEMERAVEKAIELLEYQYPEKDTRALVESLRELRSGIDFIHNQAGIGLFVSPNTRLAVTFPFPVKEKLVVGENFEIRDLLYKVYTSRRYYALLLSREGARLFEGSREELEEIRDRHFPRTYQDEYEYNQPSRSSSYAGEAHVKSFEKEKSVLEEKRYQAFFKEVDESLKSYIIGSTPLLLMGTEKAIAWFEEVSSHQKNTIARIDGSYSHWNLKQLGELLWPLVSAQLDKEGEVLVQEFRESLGHQRGVSGIQDAWGAAWEGKALKLLIEKDYQCAGFLDETGNHLYLRPPMKAHRTLPDAADDLIELVLEKNGDVVFLENGKLEEYGGVALITRY